MFKGYNSTIKPVPGEIWGCIATGELVTIIEGSQDSNAITKLHNSGRQSSGSHFYFVKKYILLDKGAGR